MPRRRLPRRPILAFVHYGGIRKSAHLVRRLPGEHLDLEPPLGDKLQQDGALELAERQHAQVIDGRSVVPRLAALAGKIPPKHELVLDRPRGDADPGWVRAVSPDGELPRTSGEVSHGHDHSSGVVGVIGHCQMGREEVALRPP